MDRKNRCYLIRHCSLQFSKIECTSMKYTVDTKTHFVKTLEGLRDFKRGRNRGIFSSWMSVPLGINYKLDRWKW
jgi:hypothetical protein